MSKELQNKRQQIVIEMRATMAKAEGEKRAFTSDENEAWAKQLADIESIDAMLKRQEELDQLQADAAEPVVDVPVRAGAKRNATLTERDAAHERAFGAYLRNGINGVSPDDQAILSRTFVGENGQPIRAAQTVTTSGGGYLIPQGFSGQIEEALKQYGGMIQAAETINTDTGNPLPWPTDNDTTNSGELLAINTAATEQDLSFGQITFGAFKFSSKLVLVPLELLQDSYFDLNAYLIQRFSVRLGRILNTKFTTGAGTTEPNGIITAATAGPVGASGETTSLIFDDLVALEHSIDPAYRTSPKCAWMMADSTVKAVKLLKDSAGRPLWLPSFQASFEQKYPDTILGYPVIVNQDVPVMAANAKSILFGDFSKYKIRRVMGMTALRLTERYAEYGQVGFLAFMRADGNLIDAGTHPVKYFANSAS